MNYSVLTVEEQKKLVIVKLDIAEREHFQCTLDLSIAQELRDDPSYAQGVLDLEKKRAGLEASISFLQKQL